MSFGARLKHFRDLAGLTQDQVARKIDVTTMTISNYERGVTAQPKAAHASAIAKVLGVPLSRLLEGDDEPEAAPDDLDAIPTEQDAEFRRVAEFMGAGEDGVRALRAVRRSIGALTEEAMMANLRSWKAARATADLAFAKGADRSQAEPSRLPEGARKAAPIKRKAGR